MSCVGPLTPIPEVSDMKYASSILALSDNCPLVDTTLFSTFHPEGRYQSYDPYQTPLKGIPTYLASSSFANPCAKRPAVLKYTTAWFPLVPVGAAFDILGQLAGDHAEQWVYWNVVCLEAKVFSKYKDLSHIYMIALLIALQQPRAQGSWGMFKYKYGNVITLGGRS